MDSYIGKICPYCKTPLTRTDNVVICGQCEIPHHTDCWVENRGCTTFGCTGAVKEADMPPAPSADGGDSSGAGIFCTHCGARNAFAGTYCIACGSMLVRGYTGEPPRQGGAPAPQTVYACQDAQADTSVNGNQVNPEAEFLGADGDYYGRKFAYLRNKGSVIGWNWASFFWGPIWCAYRKMYRSAFLIAALYLIIYQLGAASGILTLVIGVAMGMLGDNMYKGHVENLVMGVNDLDGQARSETIRKQGGTSIGMALLVLVVMTVANTLFTMLRAYYY